MNAEEILAIRRPAELFGPDARSGFRKLAAAWHPDVCADPRAGEVLRHLTEVRKLALSGGEKTRPAEKIFERADGSAFRVRPLTARRCDFGEIITCENSISMIHDADAADLAERDLKIVAGFRFADDRMRKEMERQLPGPQRRIDLADGRMMITLPRGRDELILADLMARNGPLPPVHAAWLVSRLLNIAAWLEWSGRCHGAISPETIIIDPVKHGARLAFGWGVSVEAGCRPPALPARTLGFAPHLKAAGAVISTKDDRELIRLTIREAMGDASGTRVDGARLAPAMDNWLRFPAAETAIKDLRGWSKALAAEFPARSFEQWKVDVREILSRASY